MSETASLAPARGAAAFGALVGGAMAMGISPIFVRWADVGPFASAFWRVALALPLLWLWMRSTERSQPRRRFSWPTLLAGLAFTGDLLFWHSAILHTSVANATFFATTAPIWVIAFGWLLFREKVGRETLIGLALCLAGGAALLAQSLQLRPEHALGDLYGLATGVFFGLYFLAVEAARRTTGAARVTFESSVVTAAALLAVALASEPRLLAVEPLRGLGPARHGLGEPRRRPGTAHGGARPAAGDLLVLGDLSRSDRRRAVRLRPARRADLARPGPRRPVDHGRHLHRPPAPSLTPSRAPGRVLRG